MNLSAQPQDSPQITNALWYASLGWSVVPAHKVVSYADGTTGCTCPAGSRCISKGKHPAITWTHYQKERASEDQIRAWFEGPYSGYGLGIVTGAVSGIFVIDVDEGPGKPGSETINDLQMIHGDLPFTVQARTGGGGRHIIFRHPGNVWVTTAKNVLGAGVDVRGDGGFIVAAPSLHESGRFYLWDDLAHPATTPVMDAPQWVLEMAETPPPDAHGQRAPSTGTGEIVRDAWGKVIDGREKHMVTIICAVIAGKLRETGALPSVDTVVHEAWPSYERTARPRGASLEADNRGISLMRQRTGHMLRRAAAGKWRIKGDRQSSGPTPGEPPKEDASKRSSKPPILSLEEVESLPPPEWLVKGLFPERGLIVPYGPPKGGKTFIILSIGLHVAAGMDWFGHEVCQGGVVYIAGEGIGGLGIRTRAMRSRYNIPVNIPFWVIRRAINFTLPTAAVDLIKLIRDTVLDEPIAMVVIDTLARAMPGAEENSAKEVGLVIAACAEVQDALECAVVPIHHQGKDATRGARGTSALRGAWDTAMEITTAGRRTTVTVVDQKEAEAGQRLVFDLEQISVGLTRSSLVPMLVTPGGDDPEPQQEAARQRAVGGQAGVALTTLRNLMAGPESAMLPPFADIPPDTRGVQYEVWRRSFYEKMPGEEPAARRQALKRARDELLKRNLIGVKEPWVWLV